MLNSSKKFTGSLLQNGFCTNFSDLEAKSCSPKNAPKSVPKNAPKNAPKNGMFSPNFSTEFFSEFRSVFFCSKNSTCHRKTASKKFSQKIHRGTEQKSRVPTWQGWKPLNMPLREAKIIPKNWKFLQLAVLHLSAFQQKVWKTPRSIPEKMLSAVQLPESVSPAVLHSFALAISTGNFRAETKRLFLPG